VLIPTTEMIEAAEASLSAALVEEMAVALPTSVNLISYMSPIRNQAARGTCVSFTLTALNEYILRRRGITQNLSEQHLYYETKLIDGSPSACGTWQAKAVLVLRDRGQCREVVWPYNPNPPCNNHGALPAQARPDGLQYRLATFAVATRNVTEYKTNMAKQRPVTLSIPVYNSWYQSAETRRSGRITMRVGNEQAVGGHAVCLVGYQDTPSSPGGGYFIVRNHWDTTWAYQSPYGAGYGTIPYQYITTEAWEAFSAIVPGIGTDSEEDRIDEETKTGESTVTIQVGSNIKITISAGK
jgi:C1A family cysteine protease